MATIIHTNPAIRFTFDENPKLRAMANLPTHLPQPFRSMSLNPCSHICSRFGQRCWTNDNDSPRPPPIFEWITEQMYRQSRDTSTEGPVSHPSSNTPSIYTKDLMWCLPQTSICALKATANSFDVWPVVDLIEIVFGSKHHKMRGCLLFCFTASTVGCNSNTGLVS